MSQTLFLCRVCFPNPDPNAMAPAVASFGACDYCGALCSNDPNSTLPRGTVVAADAAPPPRALTRQERDAQVREAPPFIGESEPICFYADPGTGQMYDPRAEAAFAAAAPPIVDPEPAKPPKKRKGKAS